MRGPGRATASWRARTWKELSFFLDISMAGHLVGRATRHHEQRSERELKKVVLDLRRGRVESLADRARLPYRHGEAAKIPGGGISNVREIFFKTLQVVSECSFFDLVKAVW